MTRRLYLLLLFAVVLPGVLVVLIVANALFVTPDPYDDIALLILIFTAPLLLAGIIASVEGLSVLRGRPVTHRRATVVAVLVLLGGAVLAWLAVGQVVLALLTRPGDVRGGWPLFIVGSPDGGEAYHRLDGEQTWVAMAWLLVAAVALVATVREARSLRRRDDRREIHKASTASAVDPTTGADM